MISEARIGQQKPDARPVAFAVGVVVGANTESDIVPLVFQVVSQQAITGTRVAFGEYVEGSHFCQLPSSMR